MVMKTNKRAQAALEFLTTYGWAFLVILIMIGALAYFGVLNPSNLVPDSCTAGDGFTCQEYVGTAGVTPNSVQLIAVNSLETIVISDAVITESTNTACAPTDSNVLVNDTDLSATNITMSSGTAFPIDISCASGEELVEGERMQGSVDLTYIPVGKSLAQTATIEFSVQAE